MEKERQAALSAPKMSHLQYVEELNLLTHMRFQFRNVSLPVAVAILKLELTRLYEALKWQTLRSSRDTIPPLNQLLYKPQ